MTTLQTNKDLYDTVHSVYGHSFEWISGLMKELDVTYNTAEHLVLEAGYYRHKLENATSLDAFSKKPYARYVIKKKGLVIL